MSQTLIFLLLDSNKYITLPRIDKSINKAFCNVKPFPRDNCSAALLSVLVLLISGAFIKHYKKAVTTGSAAGTLVQSAGSELWRTVWKHIWAMAANL